MIARGVLIGLTLGGALAMVPAVAAARHGSRHGSTKVQLGGLLATAQAQKESHDLVAARASLEQAYALQPSAAVLCALGTLAAADGRPLDAQDAWRRCRTAAPSTPGEPGTADTPPSPPPPPPESGELSVAGPHRGLLLVDTHVVGALPLTLPLLLAPGTHQVQLTAGARRVSTEVAVLPGRAVRLTFSGKPTVKPLPAVALLVDFSHSPDAAGPLLHKAAAEAVQAQHLGLLGQWGRLAEKLELSGCADAPCEQTLAERHRLRYVVAARATAEPDGWQLWTQLFDAEIGDVASEEAADCERCTVDQAGARLQELLTKTLSVGQSRPTGVLEVTSTPPGGEVLLAGLRLGQTPLRRTAFAGEHTIVVQRAGFLPYQNEVVVEPGRGAAIDATLRESAATPSPATAARSPEHATGRGSDPASDPAFPTSAATDPALALSPSDPALRAFSPGRHAAAAPAGRTARPRWRVGLGAAVTTVGTLLVGFGITGLAVDGRCTQSPVAAPTGELCPSGRVVNSGGVGAALLAGGLGSLGVGATLWALPGTRAPEAAVTAPVHSDDTTAAGSL